MVWIIDILINDYNFFCDSCVWMTANGRTMLPSKSSPRYYDRAAKNSSLLGAIAMMKLRVTMLS
jgi:hypothetical protein